MKTASLRYCGINFKPPHHGKQAGREHRARRKLREGEAVVLARFIGATPGSTELRTLLIGLCRQLGEVFAIGGSLPAEVSELRKELETRLASATAEHPVYLPLDALDQLASTDGAHSLWSRIISQSAPSKAEMADDFRRIFREVEARGIENISMVDVHRATDRQTFETEVWVWDAQTGEPLSDVDKENIQPALGEEPENPQWGLVSRALASILLVVSRNTAVAWFPGVIETLAVGRKHVIGQ